MITQKYLQDFFDYNQNSGVFTRKKKTGASTKVGEIVGKNKGNGYFAFCVLGKLQYVHRMAWLYVYGEIPSKNIDHINRNPSDNRLCNLRLVNQSQNTANSTIFKANTSGFKGVTFRKDTKKWQAQIMVNYKLKNLGSFESKEEAYEARKKAAIKFFGEYSNQ